MARFIFLYTGRAPKLSELPPDQSTTVLNGWKQWGQNSGDTIIDIGTPLGSGVDLVDNGEQAEPLPISGYAIIQAQDMNQALALAKTHPFLSGKEGKFSITVYELLTELPTATAQTQPNPQPINAEQITPIPPQAAGALPPVQPEATPPASPGELTIPHEQTESEQPPTELPPPADT